MAGVVASLALAVALTVMVTSFREAVTQWLDTVLPADLYARFRQRWQRRRVRDGGADQRARALPGVARVEGQRVASIQLDAQRPAVALIARPMDDAARRLPLLGELFDAPAGITAVYASEPLANVYGLRAGQRFELPLPDGRREPVFVRGVWRTTRAPARRRGDRRGRLAAPHRRPAINDMALWLAPGADTGTVQAGIRHLAARIPRSSSPRPARSAHCRCASSTAASPSPTGCRRWPSRSGWWASRRVSRRRCWHGSASSACSPTWGSHVRRCSPWSPAKARWTAAGVLLGLALGIAVSAVLVHGQPAGSTGPWSCACPGAAWGRWCAAMAAAGA
ncbi:MAG: hypothetical protein IPP50_22295 [Piscinibacter sp.]|nr:hypothetical protein [Piscinibacter sp.]